MQNIAKPLNKVNYLINKTFKYWALVPGLFVILFLTTYPAINLLRLTFSKIDIIEGDITWKFVGFRNVHLLLRDWQFLTSIKNTFIFVFSAVTSQMLLGFAIALLISNISKGKGIYRTIILIPILVPAVAIGAMWRLMYNYNFGIFNQVLVTIGFSPIQFLSSPDVAMVSIVIVNVWHWTPFVFLILLAGIQSIPIDVLESARVDGASRLQRLRYIIIPMMRHIISVALVLRTIDAFKVFGEIFLLTRGGPGTATEVTNLYIYSIFFDQYRLGYGSLVSIITILIISGIAFCLRRIVRERE